MLTFLLEFSSFPPSPFLCKLLHSHSVALSPVPWTEPDSAVAAFPFIQDFCISVVLGLLPTSVSSLHHQCHIWDCSLHWLLSLCLCLYPGTSFSPGVATVLGTELYYRWFLASLSCTNDWLKGWSGESWITEGGTSYAWPQNVFLRTLSQCLKQQIHWSSTWLLLIWLMLSLFGIITIADWKPYQPYNQLWLLPGSV